MQEVVVSQAFFANGADRRPGELMPKAGINMPDLIKQHFVNVLDEPHEGVACEKCSRRFWDDDILRAHMEIEHAKKKAVHVEPEAVPEVRGMEPAPDGTLRPAQKRKGNQE